MELHSHATLSELIAKLTPVLRSHWGEKSWAMQPQLATVEDLDQWLDGVAMAENSIRAGSMEPKRSSTDSKSPSRGARRGQSSQNVFATATESKSETPPKNQSTYPVCDSKSPHHLKDYRKFQSLAVENRAEIMKEKGFCFHCLGRNHISRTCSGTQRCDKPDCDGVHHPLLHGAPKMFPKEPKPTTPVSFSGSISTEAYAGKRTMLPMVPIILRANFTFFLSDQTVRAAKQRERDISHEKESFGSPENERQERTGITNTILSRTRSMEGVNMSTI